MLTSAQRSSTVESEPLPVCGHDSLVVIRGRVDTFLAFDDGSFGVIDFKTTLSKEAHVSFYGRQLHAYAWACEWPIRGPALTPVSTLGLLCHEPKRLVTVDDVDHLQLERTFIPIDRDDAVFDSFLGEVLDVVEGPPPAPADDCQWCWWAPGE